MTKVRRYTTGASVLDAQPELDICMRLKLQLLSDLLAEAIENEDEVEVDSLLMLPRFDNFQIATHLARQLKLDYERDADLDGTMIYVADELDRRARGQSTVEWDLLAQSAIEPLSTREVLATALAGQRAWKSTTFKAGTIGALDQTLRRALISGLSSSLAELESHWREIDFDDLYERREGAQERIAKRQVAWEKQLEDQAKAAEISTATEAAQEEARKRIQRRKPENIRKQVLAAVQSGPSTASEIFARRGRQLQGVTKSDVFDAVRYLGDLGRVTWDGELDDDTTVRVA
jgi:hypothetical protein